MKYILKLYVVGGTTTSNRAVSNLKKICTELLEDKYAIEIIDILKNPKLAVDESIIAIPTLIKKLPLPLRRVIGDLSDTDNVLLGLGLKPNIDTKKEIENEETQRN